MHIMKVFSFENLASCSTINEKFLSPSTSQIENPYFAKIATHMFSSNILFMKAEYSYSLKFQVTLLPNLASF